MHTIRVSSTYLWVWSPEAWLLGPAMTPGLGASRGGVHEHSLPLLARIHRSLGDKLGSKGVQDVRLGHLRVVEQGA